MVKKSEVEKVMLEILNKHPEGIRSDEFVAEVRRKTEVSTVKVFQFAKDLESRGRLERVKDRGDARKVWYRPVQDKVKADIKRYAIMQFLERLKEPQLFERRERVDGADVTVTVLFERVGKPIEKPDLSIVFNFAKLLIEKLPAGRALLAMTMDKSSFTKG